MRILRSSVPFALVSALLLSIAPPSAFAQEVPQPLLGYCCSCNAKVKFNKKMDFLNVGARIIPALAAIIDPLTTGLTVTLQNADGTIFTETIAASAFYENSLGTRFLYKNSAAKKNGGVRSVTLRPSNDNHGGGYDLDIRAYGDFVSATLAEMTTTIVIGTSSFTDTSDWAQRPKGWRTKFQTP